MLITSNSISSQTKQSTVRAGNGPRLSRVQQIVILGPWSWRLFTNGNDFNGNLNDFNSGCLANMENPQNLDDLDSGLFHQKGYTTSKNQMQQTTATMIGISWICNQQKGGYNQQDKKYNRIQPPITVHLHPTSTHVRFDDGGYMMLYAWSVPKIISTNINVPLDGPDLLLEVWLLTSCWWFPTATRLGEKAWIL